MKFRDSDIMNTQIDKIISCNGINNYLLDKKIDILKNEEQKIIDSNGNIIGKFLNLQN